MKSLQDNLSYYKKQKQEIMQNKQSYQSVRCHNEYGAWQPSSYTFSGHEILAAHGLSWWYSICWTDSRDGQHMKSDPATMASIRQEIAQKLGRPVDEINPALAISARGDGVSNNTTRTGWGDAIMFNSYTVGYQHRKSHQREERFFDKEKYDQALRDCEQNIISTQSTIVEVQKQQDLQKAINREDTKIASNNAQINVITAKIQEENAKRQVYELKCLELQAANKQINEKLEQQKDATYKMLQSADNHQRAFFLSGLWGVNEAEPTINLIKSLGFDANDLAHYAINKNQEALFDLALAYGANCCNYFVENETLLQWIIHENKEGLLQKVLSKGQELTSTIVTAIAQNDLLTIDKLLRDNLALLAQKYAGFTLLQIAIAAEVPHTEVINKLLSLDSKAAEILTNNGESALKIAVRIGNNEVITLVSVHANLAIELGQLGTKVDENTKAQILVNHDTEALIKLFKEEVALVAEHHAGDDAHEANSLADYAQEFVTDTFNTSALMGALQDPAINDHGQNI